MAESAKKVVKVCKSHGQDSYKIVGHATCAVHPYTEAFCATGSPKGLGQWGKNRSVDESIISGLAMENLGDQWHRDSVRWPLGFKAQLRKACLGEVWHNGESLVYLHLLLFFVPDIWIMLLHGAGFLPIFVGHYDRIHQWLVDC